jgi:hypothetical protein
MAAVMRHSGLVPQAVEAAQKMSMLDEASPASPGAEQAPVIAAPPLVRAYTAGHSALEDVRLVLQRGQTGRSSNLHVLTLYIVENARFLLRLSPPCGVTPSQRRAFLWRDPAMPHTTNSNGGGLGGGVAFADDAPSTPLTRQASFSNVVGEDPLVLDTAAQLKISLRRFQRQHAGLAGAGAGEPGSSAAPAVSSVFDGKLSQKDERELELDLKEFLKGRQPISQLMHLLQLRASRARGRCLALSALTSACATVESLRSKAAAGAAGDAAAAAGSGDQFSRLLNTSLNLALSPCCTLLSEAGFHCR